MRRAVMVLMLCGCAGGAGDVTLVATTTSLRAGEPVTLELRNRGWSTVGYTPCFGALVSGSGASASEDGVCAALQQELRAGQTASFTVNTRATASAGSYVYQTSVEVEGATSPLESNAITIQN